MGHEHGACGRSGRGSRAATCAFLSGHLRGERAERLVEERNAGSIAKSARASATCPDAGRPRAAGVALRGGRVSCTRSSSSVRALADFGAAASGGRARRTLRPNGRGSRAPSGCGTAHRPGTRSRHCAAPENVLLMHPRRQRRCEPVWWEVSSPAIKRSERGFAGAWRGRAAHQLARADIEREPPSFNAG